MRNKKQYHISFLLMLLAIVFAGFASAQDKVYLFPDRSFCASGDTLWFSTLIVPDGDINSNVVHVQLDNTGNRHITKVSVLCTDNQGQGYLPIPDSLSTGTYFVKAFINDSKNNGQPSVYQRFITVYNRFDEKLDQIKTPQVNNTEEFKQFDKIKITTGNSQPGTREKVNVKIEIPGSECSNLASLIIMAGMADPLSEDLISTYLPVTKNRSVIPSASLIEKDGILVNGKVFSSEDKKPIAGAIVLLSIPDTIPYFDYCISDSVGMFYFYLRNATGTGNLVIQARTADHRPYEITLLNNYIETEEVLTEENTPLTYEQKAFAEAVINASYFDKLFTTYLSPTSGSFSIPVKFKFPFYGEPTTTIYPELFIDLPNFTEVSRELLHGVQYREKKEGSSVRMYNYGGNHIFDQEPLKLLDGIPVFDSHIFSKMGTSDIRKIDEVFYERFFGDLSFQGVLAVYSKKQFLGWVESVPGLNLFSYPCLQTPATWNLNSNQPIKPNIPDFRKMFYRNQAKEVQPVTEFTFQTSDLKGNLAIRVIAITKQNQVLYVGKLIEIK